MERWTTGTRRAVPARSQGSVQTVEKVIHLFGEIVDRFLALFSDGNSVLMKINLSNPVAVPPKAIRSAIGFLEERVLT
jgi:hypothetical protein